jgi:hypothetical protein
VASFWKGRGGRCDLKVGGAKRRWPVQSRCRR